MDIKLHIATKYLATLALLILAGVVVLLWKAGQAWIAGGLVAYACITELQMKRALKARDRREYGPDYD